MLLLPFVNLNVAHFLIILDVDECVKNLHNCGSNAVCNNNPGSFNCTCSPGYHGDGHNCRRNYFFTHFCQCCVFILKLANLCTTVITRMAQRPLECFHMTSQRPCWCPKTKKMAAMLVSQTKPLGIELYFYANAFFCFSKPIWSVVT